MALYQSILETIGETPLVRLNKIGADLDADLFVKLESANPTGSIKDRIALRMIEAAEESGELKPGSTIIEGTAGNTGAGLAQAAAVKGYKCIFVVPDKMSIDKIDFLKAYGAKVIVTNTSVSPDSPENYIIMSRNLAKEIKDSFIPSQFTNMNNPKTHYMTTGPEIWKDLNGKVDVLVGGVGTGGTISGCGKFLKEKNNNLKVVLADPPGSILSKGDGKSWVVEGIGEDFFPETYDKDIIDDFEQITDKESFLMARDLVKKEGIFAGGSSGTAMAAALKYAEKLGVTGNVVVILPDTGRNYMSKCHSDEWMRKNGYLEEEQS